MIYYGRNHWYTILINYYKLLKRLWAVLIVITIPSIAYGFDYIIFTFILLASFCFLKWLNEYIFINEEYLIYKKGIFMTERVKIPLNSISLVEFKRNVIYVIMGIQKLKIESISPKDRRFDIVMIIKKDKIREFQKVVTINTNLYTGYKVQDNISAEFGYKIYGRHLLILATLRSNIILGIGIIYSLAHFISLIDQQFKEDIKDLIFKLINNSFLLTKDIGAFIIYFLISIIILVVVITIFSIIGIIFKYYKFRLYRIENYINIKHGLLVRKEYSININKVHAIKIEQNLINQILGLYTLKAAVVGFGNSPKEDEIIFPLCDKEICDYIIKDIIPEFKFTEKIHTPPKRAFNNFYMSWTGWSAVITIIIYFMTKGSLIGGILIPLTILWRFLVKKNSGLAVSDDVLYFSSRSFVRRIFLIRASSMIECTKVVNPFQRRKDICDYKIRFYSQRKMDWIKVKNMESYLYKEIKDGMNKRIKIRRK